MARFIGFSSLLNPAYIVRLFPKKNKYGTQDTLAETRDGQIVNIGMTWDQTEEWNEADDRPVIANVDTALRAVIYWPPEQDGKPRIDRLPIVGWRLPGEWADNSCLIPITICGEFDPTEEHWEVAVKTALGYVSLGHGEDYASELEFAVAAGQRFAERAEAKARAEAERKAKAATQPNRYAI